MKRAPARDCPRLWEAEALQDGRLHGVDRLSFERHVASCDACQRERASLVDLREAMRALPEAPSSPFAKQGQRARLLREANRQVLLGGRPERVRRVARLSVAGVLVTAAASASVAVVLHTRSDDVRLAARETEIALVTPPPAPTYDVSSERGASWTSHTEGSAARVVLSSGTAQFHVRHLVAGQRFLVALPDGEIEVRGTRFTVTVAEGRTESVAVSEGTVLLRQTGREEVLAAGAQWSPEPPPVASVSAVDPGVAQPRPRHAPSPPRAGDVFAEAIRSFDAGHLARADGELARFVREFPGDPRCEDAAFLRAVAHARTGDRSGAEALAHAYLAAYPHGLRRAEAESLAAP